MSDQEKSIPKSVRMSHPAPRHVEPLAKVLALLEPMSLRDARHVLRLAELTIDERVRAVDMQSLPNVSLDVIED